MRALDRLNRLRQSVSPKIYAQYTDLDGKNPAAAKTWAKQSAAKPAWNPTSPVAKAMRQKFDAAEIADTERALEHQQLVDAQRAKDDLDRQRAESAAESLAGQNAAQADAAKEITKTNASGNAEGVRVSLLAGLDYSRKADLLDGAKGVDPVIAKQYREHCQRMALLVFNGNESAARMDRFDADAEGLV